MFAFDNVSPLERIRLTGQLSKKIPELVSARESKQPLKVVRISSEVAAILAKLGVGAPAPEQAKPEYRSVQTSRFYPQEQRRTLGARQKENDSALELMQRLQSEGRKATDEEKAVLARFSGYGGGLTDKDGKEGSPYEYYTPAAVAEGMWGMLAEMGFTGGKVLDPSAGSGVFAATRPQGVVIDQVELSDVSGGVNALVNDDPTVSTKISPFEAIAAVTPDESYDLVMTNVPFGDAKLRLFAKQDTKYRNASLEAYFILRSLDKLKPGGLAAFITPPRCVSGNDAKSKDLRFQASLKAEFLGAYRLPNKVFQDASNADTIVDVIVFRKHSAEAKAKIEELSAQNIEALRESLVLWDEYLTGKYFVGEGRRFQLGEFQAKDPAKFRDVDRVISDQSTASIAKLIRKFPGSRIKWDVLGAAEAAPIVYQEGDTIYQDGRTLQYTEGRWVAIADASRDNAEMMGIGVSMETPLQAVAAGVTWSQCDEWLSYMNARAMTAEIPDWAAMTGRALSSMPEGVRAGWFNAICAGLATIDVLNEHAPNEPFNYAEAYPLLTSRLQDVASYGNKSSGAFNDRLRDAAKTIGVVYSKKSGFFPRWKGEGKAQVEVAGLTPKQAYEKLKYEASDDYGFVPLDRLAETQGADFDAFASDDWCISPDGKSAIAAGDYYTGNYADFTEKLEADLAAAEDPKVRAKIIRQRDVADSRLIKADPKRMSFNLFSPFVPIARKVEFLRDNVDSRFSMEFNDKGVAEIIINIGSTKNEQERQLKRFAEHLRKGTMTTRTSEAEASANPELEAQRLAQLREIASSAAAKFNVWVKSNPDAFEEVRAKLNAPESLFFREEEDTSALTIDGMNPSLSLHDYQRAEVRRQAKKFGGINGFDVGLGKTFTALASIQYVQSIGVKRKTCVVVPNAVLSNWRKEASRAYISTDDCLFVGLDLMPDGTIRVSSGNYARDMARILENRHRKVFMTMEAFAAIPMRQETLEAYQSYMASVDPSFSEATEKKTEEIRKDKKRDSLTETGSKSSALPFFEDMNFDSIVSDESHAFKNSRYLVTFQGAKYLSDATPSSRGLDMQVKAWFIRGLTPKRDGVMCLTATPITNSPLEIYGMLCLAAGERELNARLNISGADDFMKAFSSVENLEEPDLLGRPRAGRVFLGLDNVELLRGALGSIANIKDADDVGAAISVPDEEPVKTAVDLDAKASSKLSLYQSIYQLARDYVNEVPLFEEQQKILDDYSAKTGEPIELLAHPFNLINKMSNLIMDKDLDEGLTKYAFGASQADAVKKAVDQFNAKKLKETRSRPGQYTKPQNVTMKTKKNKDDTETTIAIVQVEAWIDGGNVVIDTTDFDTQGRFLLIAEKAGIDLDSSVSPKVAAFLANFRKEQATPRATGGIAKQIIFCDMLGMHHKLKMLISKQCGIPANKIGIINAVAVSDPADMQDIQDGFNAEADENRYAVIIANKKAEVGINLQKGTQAIHHLTLGWTPDSLTQRNGRGVRQGNYLGKVTVYHYDANGTFDEYKRMLVGKKDDWITKVMAKDGGNSVTVSGGISESDMHDLMMASGDATAMQKARDQIERRERQRQTEASRNAQVQTLRVLQGQQAWLKKFSDGTEYRDAKIYEYADLEEQSAALNAKIGRAKNEDVIARLKRQQADIDARRIELGNLLEGGSLDWSGKPRDGKGYRIAGYGREKGQPKPEGKINPESALYAKYVKEKDAVQSALEQAKAEYNAMASRPGAYKESTLEELERGDAAIVGGSLISKGMVGRHKGKLWIAASPQELVHPPTKKKIPAESAISGFEFFGPADADEDWFPVAEECAAIDDQTISENAETGFEVGDVRLYSTFSPQIAERVKASPSGMACEPSRIRLKAPMFPTPIHPSTNGGPVVAKIIKEQASVVSWSRKSDPWGRETDVVRVRDLRFADEYEWTRIDEAALKYAEAHGEKLTNDDLQSLGGFYRAKMFGDNLKGFDAALADAMNGAKTASDIDASIRAFIVANAAIFAFDDERFTEESLLSTTQKTKLEKAKLSLAAGGKPIVWIHELANDYMLKTHVCPAVADEMAKTPEAFVVDGKSIAENMNIADAGEQMALAMRGDAQAAIDGAYNVKPFVRDLITKQAEGSIPPGGLILMKGTEVGSFATSFYSNGWANVRKAVSAHIASAANAGVDIPAIIAKLESLPGVDSAKVASSAVYRSAKYGNGSYTYEANTSIAVKTRKGSDTATRVSDKASGLTGRHWDKDNGWMLTVKDGATDSYGKPVASVNDFIKFVSGGA